ncbi:unnamed protein product, partial [Clonostachys chloroleuca]
FGLFSLFKYIYTDFEATDPCDKLYALLAFGVFNDHQFYHWKRAMGHFHWGNDTTLIDDLTNLDQFSKAKYKWATELPAFIKLFNCVRSKLTWTAEWAHVADEANRLIELVATGKEKIQKAIDFLDNASC